MTNKQLSVTQQRKLLLDSFKIREEIIDIAATLTGCHIGGSLSITDLLNYSLELYGNNPLNEVILSKGHAAAALYAALFTKGILKEKPSLSYGIKGSLLLGHPNNELPGIPYSTGSLGHGIGYGAGWALVQRLKQKEGIAVVLGGDGELQEGSVWEALQVISSKQIHNLIYIIDRNQAQNDGFLDNISEYYDLSARFKSFGFQVVEIDGHNFNNIHSAFQNKSANKALVIIADTVKGKGIRLMEGNPKSHYAKISVSQADKWKKQIKYQYEKNYLN